MVSYLCSSVFTIFSFCTMPLLVVACFPGKAMCQGTVRTESQGEQLDLRILRHQACTAPRDSWAVLLVFPIKNGKSSLSSSRMMISSSRIMSFISFLPCPYQVNIQNKKHSYSSIMFTLWLFLLLSPNFSFTLFYSLMIDLCYKRIKWQFICSCVTFVRIDHFSEVGKLSSWKHPDFSRKLQDWIPQVKYRWWVPRSLHLYLNFSTTCEVVGLMG